MFIKKILTLVLIEKVISIKNPESMESLFSIEYMTITDYEFTEISWSSTKTNWIKLPMHKIIPIHEKLSLEDNEKVKQMIEGKLIDIALSNMTEDNLTSYKSILFRKDQNFKRK